MSRRILVVEDDPHIRLGLMEALKSEGYDVCECREGLSALKQIRALDPALVILDVMLPGKSGFDICRELRASKNQVPVLMLTAKGQEVDKVVGLELGADDYVTKPFGLRELLARVAALLRRAGSGMGGHPIPDEIPIGQSLIHPASLRGRCGRQDLEFTPREMALLVLLAHERGNAVSRDRILNEVWGMDYLGTTRTLDQVIVKLRQKLEPDPANPVYLLTVHGYGYRLESLPKAR
ncbi:MAG: response regulator transcription factor [Terrimicrobiaceae bacterium]